jgi:hypothetical protein
MNLLINGKYCIMRNTIACSLLLKLLVNWTKRKASSTMKQEVYGIPNYRTGNPGNNINPYDIWVFHCGDNLDCSLLGWHRVLSLAVTKLRRYLLPPCSGWELKVAHSSETLVTAYETMWCQNLENHNINHNVLYIALSSSWIFFCLCWGYK